jgi:hypothetical protein
MVGAIIMWKSAAEQISQYIPDIYDYDTALYVGASTKRQHFQPELAKAGYKIDCLEIWEQNHRLLSKRNVRHFKFDNFILGDVRECDTLIQNTYDIAVWWQGPEHIKKKELPGTFDKLLNLVTKFVIITCPWGVYPQGEYRGNPYEEHLASLYPEDFEELGWEVRAVGEENHKHAYIIAWRRKQ